MEQLDSEQSMYLLLHTYLSLYLLFSAYIVPGPDSTNAFFSMKTFYATYVHMYLIARNVHDCSDWYEHIMDVYHCDLSGARF